MDKDPLLGKIKKVLKKDFSKSGDRIVVTNGFEDLLHVYIISKQFRGKRRRARSDMLWPILFRDLEKDEWGRISLLLPLAPEEVRGSMEPALRHVKVR